MKITEVKFMAWDPENNKMYTPDFPYIGAGSGALDIAITIDGRIITPNSFGLDYAQQQTPPKLVLLQYSNFKDMHGHPVYTGHILKSVYPKESHMDCNCVCESSIFIVVFEHGQFLAVCKDTDSIALLPSNWRGHCEIIGHIYLNPELISPNA